MEQDRTGWKPVAAVFLLAAVLAFLYVWPGVCRYEYLNTPFFRADRITGQVERWTSGHWTAWP